MLSIRELLVPIPMGYGHCILLCKDGKRADRTVLERHGTGEGDTLVWAGYRFVILLL